MLWLMAVPVRRVRVGVRYREHHVVKRHIFNTQGTMVWHGKLWEDWCDSPSVSIVSLSRWCHRVRMSFDHSRPLRKCTASKLENFSLNIHTNSNFTILIWIQKLKCGRWLEGSEQSYDEPYWSLVVIRLRGNMLAYGPAFNLGTRKTSLYTTDGHCNNFNPALHGASIEWHLTTM